VKIWCHVNVSAEVLHPSMSQDRSLPLVSRSYLPAKSRRKKNHGRPYAIEIMSSKQGFRHTGHLKKNDLFDVSALLGCYCNACLQLFASVSEQSIGFQGPNCLTLEDGTGPTGCPETSVNNYLTRTS
jgi:hypothetical protein